MATKDFNGIPLQVGDTVGYSDVSDKHPFGVIKTLGRGGNVKVKFPDLPCPIGVNSRRLLKALAPVCECYFPLKEVKWNSSVNLFICNNWRCSKFHQPQRQKKIEEMLALSKVKNEGEEA